MKIGMIVHRVRLESSRSKNQCPLAPLCVVYRFAVKQPRRTARHPSTRRTIVLLVGMDGVKHGVSHGGEPNKSPHASCSKVQVPSRFFYNGVVVQQSPKRRR